MDYTQRVLGYLMQPMAIDLAFGLSEYAKFANNMSIDKGSYMEMYRRTVEESKTRLYASVNDGINPLGKTNDIGSVSDAVVAVIPLKGTMLAEGGLCTPSINDTVNSVLAAGQNPNIKGIVLETHSGGGEVVAAQRLSNAVKSVNKSKPVVQFVDGMSASGALWVGVQGQEIHMAGNTTQVGSIGVVIQMDKREIEEANENLVSIFAEGSESKQDITKAILAGDFDFVKSKSLNPIRTEFVNQVKRGRKGVDESVFSGTMFFANEAIKLGLADRKVAGLINSIKRVNTLARQRNMAQAANDAISKLK